MLFQMYFVISAPRLQILLIPIENIHRSGWITNYDHYKNQNKPKFLFHNDPLLQGLLNFNYNPRTSFTSSSTPDNIPIILKNQPANRFLHGIIIL